MSNSEIFVIVGKKVRNLRLERGLTITEVAEKLGKSASQIGSIERADRYPSFPNLIELADFYQVPLSYLFEDDLYLYHQKVSNFLLHRMQERNVSVADLANLTGLNYFMVAEFIGGRSSLELEHLKQLASALSITAEQIVPHIVKYLSLIKYYLKAMGMDAYSIANIEDYILSKLRES